MGEALAAANLGHEVEHTSAFRGFLAGAAIGLAIGVLAVATVASGGTALAIVAAVGGAVAATGGGALAGMYIGEAIKNPCGKFVPPCSSNVKIGGKAAVRAALDLVACDKHGPKRVALGSGSVFINEYPAVRRTDLTECGGPIGSDLDSVFIGGETTQYLEIDTEVPGWMVTTAKWMVIGGTAVALGFGGLAAFAGGGGWCALGVFAAQTAGGFLGGLGGAWGGGIIGEAIGGELGKRIGQTIGGLLGGMFGAKFGGRLAEGHPIDIATGEMFTTIVDFVLPGLITLAWERSWISSSRTNGALGQKWQHPYDYKLAEFDEYVALRGKNGLLTMFPRLMREEGFYHRAEQAYIYREITGDYRVDYSDAETLIFERDVKEKQTFRLALVQKHGQIALSFMYDREDRLVSIDNRQGQSLSFNYDTSNRITEVIENARKQARTLARYVYSQAGDLIKFIDAKGASFEYAYDNHLMVQEKRKSGLSFWFEWDDVELATDAKAVKTWGDTDIYWRELKYDTDSRKTTALYPNGNQVTYRYNERGYCTEEITALRRKTSYFYNKYGELEKIKQPDGARFEYHHDDFGRLTKLKNPRGHFQLFEYQSDFPYSKNLFSVKKFTDFDNTVETYRYDPQGRIVEYTDRGGVVLRYIRNSMGQVSAILDPLGTRARYLWSSAGVLTGQVNPKGGSIHFKHDEFGRVISEEIEGSGREVYEYSPNDEITTILHSDGGVSYFEYDVEGNLVSATDPTKKTTKWYYGPSPFPLTRTNPDGTKFKYKYDLDLNLVCLRNERSENYTLEYDADGRLVTEIGFDGRKQVYHYGDADYVIRAEDGHRIREFKRDKLGQLLRLEASDGDWAEYAYDEVGNLITANNPARQLSFEYDQRRNLVKEIQDDHSLEHVYDIRSQRTATFLPDGRYVKFGYDQNGSLADLSFMEREVLNIHRDRLGREKIRSAAQLEQKTKYDPQGRIEKQSVYKKHIKDPIISRQFGYTANGLIQRIEDNKRGVRAYQYDGRTQLTRVTGDVYEHYAFDPAGQILFDAPNVRSASVRGGRLLLDGDKHYEYDDAGNRTQMKWGFGGKLTCEYEYDHQNRLLAVTKIKPNERQTTKFSYDALGRRVSKLSQVERMTPKPANDNDGVPPELIEKTAIWYLWNGDVLLAEGEGDEHGAVDPLALVYVYEPGSFRPAAQIRRYEAESEGEVYLYWLDHLGTPQEITNENGEIVWQVALKAWGGIDRVYVERVGNNLRFQGQYYDQETELHYNRFRHYDPSAGMFINQDPIGLAGGEKPSAYAPNPVGWVDPLGLAPGAGCGYSSSYPKDKSTKKTEDYFHNVKSEGQARQIARTKLGSDPVKIEPGKYRSQDGKWQYRAKDGDLAGHGDYDPHIHLEKLNPKTGEVIDNHHFRWKIPRGK